LRKKRIFRSWLEELGGLGEPEARLIGFDNGDVWIGGVSFERVALEDQGTG
jgi:hypothetical protein